MYDNSLESSHHPDGRGIGEICIPPLATPPEQKMLVLRLQGGQDQNKKKLGPISPKLDFLDPILLKPKCVLGLYI